MRNGVLAVTRDGTVVEVNAEAHRIFQLKRTAKVVGRPFTEVLAKHPDIIRVLHSAFELSHLPNRAELRLRSTGKVIGYTLSHVKNDRGKSEGVVIFFKDLTKVEQLEERERLRDRLVALGEMAAAIAHEVKNPLAGIEVMAGVLKRQVAGSPDAQSILTDIINEAKMANQIVHEALEFVRPIRLQVEYTAIADVINDSVSLAESKMPRRDINLQLHVDAGLPPIQGDHHQLCQLFTNLLINAFEALEGKGAVEITAREGVTEEEGHVPGEPSAPVRTVVIDIADDGPGVPGDLRDRIFNAFFTTKDTGTRDMGGGLGLGLAISAGIVRDFGGTLTGANGPDGGAVFTVEIPAAEAGEAECPMPHLT